MKNRSLKILLAHSGPAPARRADARADWRASMPQQSAPFAIRPERASDVAARENLLDVCFGANRRTRTCERLREGRLPAQGLAFTALHKGRVAGTVRLWHVMAGGAPALMLGPLAVDPALHGLGIGAALMNHAIKEARRLGHGAIILLGDAPYYARFSFAADKAASLALPGLFARERLLALELKRDALFGASGLIRPNGAFAPSVSWLPREVRAAGKAA
jgi:predicted N-acetyltransferase YhbS